MAGEAQDGEIVKVQLRRQDTSQGWGFRMRGGAQVNMPLFVEAVNPKGRSFAAGLRAGDGILMICNADVTRASHEQAKQEMLRAGNDIDLTVKRGAMKGVQMPKEAPKRVELVEEPTQKIGGPVFKPVQPKTYKILESELGPDPNAPENRAQPAAAAVEPAKRNVSGFAGPRVAAPSQGPASIFHRKEEDRSDYLHAKGHTIQKAFGQTH